MEPQNVEGVTKTKRVTVIEKTPVESRGVGSRNVVKPRKKERRRNISKDSSSSMGLGKILGIAGGVVAGGALLFKGATGNWPFFGGDGKDKAGVNNIVDLESKLTIDRPREELYAYWRKLENLPNFMSHLKEVQQEDAKISTWVAKIPGGLGTIEWDAEIVQERTNEILRWRSLPGAEIDNAGEVHFEDALDGEGTIVETKISYRPPAGDVGGYAAKLLNPAFEKIVKKDLKEFKTFMESGGAGKVLSEPSKRV
ncbi:MAG TPA: SRPBCC family protein [Gillisia sp.]|nr:SRPBCC family protein [Gillisia sp.]